VRWRLWLAQNASEKAQDLVLMADEARADLGRDEPLRSVDPQLTVPDLENGSRIL
jgi:hypothetical protein